MTPLILPPPVSSIRHRFDCRDLRRAWTAALVVWSLIGCGTGAPSPGETATTSSDRLERTSEKGPVRLTVSVSPAQPRLSDLVDMDIQITAPTEVEVKPPTFGQAVGDFVVRDYSEKKGASAATEQAESVTHRFHYQLEPVFAGRHLIRSLGVEFIDRRTNSESSGKPALIESEPLEVEVTSEFDNKVPDLSELDPMIPPRPLNSSSTWPWFIGLGLLAATALTGMWFLRHRTTITEEPRKQSPQEVAHAALNQLLAEQLPSRGLVKEFYLRLTGIVRQFIEDTTGLKAPEQTTEEFLRAMRTRDIFSVEQSLRLKEFLEAADMVKYAGQQPDHAQIEMSIERAREFVGLRSANETDLSTSREDH